MKLLDLIGLPVYTLKTGKRLSIVKDVIISQNWEITHFELKGRTYKGSSTLLIEWEHIIACGEDAIIIINDTVIQHMEVIAIERSFLLGNKAIKNLPVITNEGMQLGWVVDVYFQPNMGNQITGLEISDGLLSDLLQGRRRLAEVNRLKWGADVIMVAKDG